MASDKRGLHQGATLLGMLLGLLLGALYAMAHQDKSGSQRRKDLTTFGGDAIEREINASIAEAKDAARQRNEDAD